MGDEQNQNQNQGGKNKGGGGGNQQKNGVSLAANIDASSMTGWEPIKASMSGHAKNAIGFIIAGLAIGLLGPVVDKLFGVKAGAAAPNQPQQIKPGQAAYELTKFKRENPEGFKAIENKFTDLFSVPPANEG